MALGLGISGIGYPAMGLGTMGLGATGSYGSYDNYMPSMMGMTGMTNPMMTMGGMGSDLTGMNPMMSGMMGMYNPLYYTQMQNAAEQIKAQHAGDMHTTLLNNEVNAYSETDSALIKKIAQNGDIQRGVMSLYEKVKKGEQDGICEEFDKLKNYIFHTYKDELAARGKKINASTTAGQIIEAVYGNVISAQTGEIANLRQDIERYGESSTMNGFMNGFRSGHDKRYIDQTIMHCYGESISEKESKDRRKEVASYVGRGASVIEKGVYGAAGGATLFCIGKGLAAGFKATFSKGAGNAVSTAAKSGFFKNLGKAAWIGAIAGAAADIWWQCSGSKEEATAA